ncbi:MAG: hypothetical protein Q8M29_18935 [Bacteroidota bacterium]|nr:hypothetical protein [Bacteroidota bacterium]
MSVRAQSKQLKRSTLSFSTALELTATISKIENMQLVKYIFLFLFLNMFYCISACNCPPAPRLDKVYTNGYAFIFKGAVKSVTPCKEGIAKSHFIVQELYKGKSPKEIDVYFDCGKECPMNFSAGETWIIYSNYAQVGKPDVSLCSRSRKLVDNEIQIQTNFIPSDYSFQQEVEWLRTNLGTHEVLKENANAFLSHRNELPSRSNALLLIGISLGSLLLLYFVFKKFIK